MNVPTPAEMVERLDDQLTEALMQGRRADSEGIQNQLDMYRDEAETDALKATIDALNNEANRWHAVATKLECAALARDAKLHTLEAAVRAVRDGDEGKGGDLGMDFVSLYKLYALVPEAGS